MFEDFIDAALGTPLIKLKCSDDGKIHAYSQKHLDPKVMNVVLKVLITYCHFTTFTTVFKHSGLLKVFTEI